MMRDRAVRAGLLAVAGALFLSACGGHPNATAPASGLRSPYAPLASMQHNARAADPDSSIVGGSDALTSLTEFGNGRFRLLVENVSSIGFINSFLWQAPFGMTITKVTGSAPGNCRLLTNVVRTKHDSVPYGIGEISCAGIALKPPKCTCLVGGSMTIDFTAEVPRVKKGHTTSLLYGTLKVENVTPVPYVIPSSLSEKPSRNADLPICKRGQRPTAAAPCILSG